MSQKSVEQIMGKMLLDVEFRNLMTSDRAKTLEEFDLTAEERENFNNVVYLVWMGGW